MSTTLKKLRKSLEYYGVLRTSTKAINYFIEAMKYKFFKKKILKLQSVEDKFTWIYKNNLWGSVESASGPGSTLRYTENLRKELPALLLHFQVNKIFDAPCGDFNWMRHLLPKIDVEYVGGDIVRALIEQNKKKYSTTKISFVCIDLIKDALPKADLMMCRDCLFHLSFQDTKSVFKNFVDSGIPYLLTTTHKQSDTFFNKDIQTGDFRYIDLFSAPYHLSSNPLAIIEDGVYPDPKRQMCLWSREQVADALTKFP